MGDVIWLVTKGDYSAYQVVAAFTTKELAAAYAEHAEGVYSSEDDVEVEDYPLYSELPELVEILTCEVGMLDGGFVFEPKEEITKRWANETAMPPVRVYMGKRDPFYSDIPVHLNIRVEGTDHARVRKVMTEVIAQAKANLDVWLVEDRAAYTAAQKLTEELADA